MLETAVLYLTAGVGTKRHISTTNLNSS